MKKSLDLATVIGFIAGLVAILGSIFLAGGIGGFIDPASMFVVIGGTIAAVLLANPLPVVVGIMGPLMSTVQATTMELNETIEMLVKFAEEARKEGLLALEGHVKEVEDPFIKTGLQLAIDGTEPELLEEILSTEIENLEARHSQGHKVFESGGTYAPAFGMMGTLIGLVFMLQSMSDPASIGPSMAVALVTTFYGAVLSNFIFLPLADKLKGRTKEEVQGREMIVAGILAIQSGDNPRLVEQKLMTFLPPKKRNTEE